MKQFALFMGPPGSGKGSLAALCVREWGWYQISTGNLCRQEIARDTPLGKRIDFLIRSGKLVPTEMIVDLLKHELERYAHEDATIILDGFPRTLPQAVALDELREKTIELRDSTVIIVRIYAHVDNIVARLTNRLICPTESCQAVYSLTNRHLMPKKPFVCDRCSSSLVKRSDDQSEAVIRERLATYELHEKLVLDYYKKRGYPLYEINGDQPLELAFSELSNKLQSSELEKTNN